MTYKPPSLFDHDEQTRLKFERMRQQAMDGELRRYFRAEARELFKQQLKDSLEAAGSSYEEVMGEQPEKPSVVETLVDLPRRIVSLFLYAIILVLAFYFFRGLFFR